MRELNVNKYGGYKGFTTLDKPCVTDRFEANVTICLSAQQQQYLYYDDIHPTTAHHALLAKLMAEALASPSDTSLCMSSACLGDSILDRCFESLAANVVVAWGSLIALLAVVAM
jgi:phospholipase/lecithinase/hemolysin